METEKMNHVVETDGNLIVGGVELVTDGLST